MTPFSTEPFREVTKVREFHTRKLHIPDRGKFDATIETYRQHHGTIPVGLTTIRNIIQDVIGWEITGDLLELDGRAYVMPCHGSFLIMVNSRSALWRRRADTAHELGHILHTFTFRDDRMENITRGLSEQGCELEERFCDELGAGLLCPEWAIEGLVLRAVEEIPNLTGKRLVARLSRQFQFPAEELEAHLRRHYNGHTIDRIVDEAKNKAC
jgi:hypothetical protein